MPKRKSAAPKVVNKQMRQREVPKKTQDEEVYVVNQRQPMDSVPDHAPVIRHLKAIGRHYASVILRIVQRMPILFCLDGFLRIKLNTGNLPIYAGLFLLLLSHQCLTSVYSAALCFLCMFSLVPLSKDVIDPKLLTDDVQKFLISISINQNFYSEWYLQVAVVFLICTLTVTQVRQTIANLCNPHKKWYGMGFIVLGILLRSNISEFPLLWNTYILVHQLQIFIFTKYVFRLHKYVHCGLIYLYYNTVPEELRPYHPIIIFIIIIAWLEIHKEENPINGAFESMTVYVTRFRLTFESAQHVFNMFIHVKDMFIAAILPYAIFLSIGLPFALYKNNITQPVTVFVQVVTIMSTTLLGTIAYIVLITYICYGCIKLTVWFLHGRYKGPEISEPISPGFILIVLEILLFDIEPTMHGRLMCFGILLIGPSLLQDIYKVSEPILLVEFFTSGANLIKQIKTYSLFLVLIFFPIFVLIKFHQLHNLELVWAIPINLSWVTFCIEMLGTIAVYCLLVYDNIKSEPFENFDDAMYYIKSTVCVVEIAVGVLNVYIYTLDIILQMSRMGIIIIGCCLFNPYQRVNNGWNTFQRRQKRVKRLASLPNATVIQLQAKVCDICLRNMSTAKITPCNHFFHESCLRKWSYVKETCPCCNAEFSDC